MPVNRRASWPRRWWSWLVVTHPRVAVVCFLAGLVFVVAVGVYPLLPSFSDPCPRRARDRNLFIGVGVDIGAGVRRELIEKWNERSELKAKLVEISESADEQRAEMAAAAQSKRCAYDVLLLDVAYIAEFARNGYLEELSPEDLQGRLTGKRPEEYFLPKSLQTGQVAGKQYAWPFSADAPLLYRRIDPQIRPPKNLEDFLNLANEYGYAAQFRDYEGGTVNLLEAIFSSGGEVTRGDRVVLNEQNNGGQKNHVVVEKGLSNWRRALFSGEGDQAVLRGESTLTEESSLQAFRDGRVGYMRNWPFAFLRLAADPEMRNDDGSLKFEVLPFPGVGVLGGAGLAIAKDSPHKSEAKDLIAELVSVSTQQKLFACAGYPPVVREVYDIYAPSSPEEKRQTCGRLMPPAAGGDRAAERDAEIKADDLTRFAGAVRTAVQVAKLRPQSAHYSTFSEVVRSCLLPLVTTVSNKRLDWPHFAEALEAALNGRRWDDACRSSSA